MSAVVDILMATYNGEKFLSQQIDSILAQTFRDWHLFIQDDCSSDGTAGIAKGYAQKHPDKIEFIQNETCSGSAKANFLSMLKLVDSEYVMFCDQDDVWLDTKVDQTYEKMLVSEQQSNKECPILVHTDLIVVDNTLHPLHGSFTKHQGLKPMVNSLNKLLTQNNVTGCTVMLNRPLQQLIKFERLEAVLMHDWWIALIASALGKVFFLNRATVLYRQHEHNSLGAVNNRTFHGIVNVIVQRLKTYKRLSATFSQADSFLKVYGGILAPSSKRTVETYLSIPKQIKITRVFMLLANRYTKQNFLSMIGQLIYC